jgi:CspA family cold shock protein
MQASDQIVEDGVVKWFNNAKGWGFISRGTDGSDVFVHYSQIAGDGYRTLKQGQTVRYRLKSGPRGQFAEAVEL